VERRLFRDDQAERNMPTARAPINFTHVHSELRRKHVTLQLLWAEYQESALARCDGSKSYQYSQFCELYGAWPSSTTQEASLVSLTRSLARCARSSCS
jgi:hypothetical protein